jgi:hypothetical protein
MSEPPIITTIAEALACATTQKGATLAGLSDERPLLLVFLRQFG